MPVNLKIILLLSFFTIQISHALEIEITKNIKITKIEAEGQSGWKYTRGFLSSGEIAALGALELNSRFVNKTGIQTVIKEKGTEINIFNNTSFIPVKKFKPFILSLSYIYNGLPGYETHSHTILPVVSLNAKWAGISIGPSLRFTSFFAQPAVFETVLSLSVYANFINGEKLRMGLFVCNFNDFYAGNFGAFTLGLDSAFRINENWTTTGKVEVLFSGGDGLATNFYGVAVRGGVKFKW